MWKSEDQERRELFERALAEMLPAANQVSERWERFSETLVFNDDVPLREQVRLFSEPLSQFFRKAYPDIASTEPVVYLTTMLIGIYLAKTHPIPEVISVAEYLEEAGISGISNMLKAFIDGTPNR